MARTDPQLNIRIPEELKQALEAAARESGRSVTQEMITRLQDSFVPHEQLTDTMKKMLQGAVEQIMAEQKKGKK